jgi:hypothetical protein
MLIIETTKKIVSDILPVVKGKYSNFEQRVMVGRSFVDEVYTSGNFHQNPQVCNTIQRSKSSGIVFYM